MTRQRAKRRALLAAGALVVLAGLGLLGLSRAGLVGGSAGRLPGVPQLRSISEQSLRIERASRATTRLDVEEAARLLEGTTGARAALAKARLALYRADCEAALGYLGQRSLEQERGASALLDLARRCHGATAGAELVVDDERGLVVRVQDEADLVVVPLLLEVLDRARAAVARDLAVELPRPLRVDLVRDLFSLAALTGLPLDAAETTGTVAVARWGRVTLLSPRAIGSGFPWEDTVAHELTHLALSRASVDAAPLWLQEGVAKLEEERWRERRHFDGEPAPGEVAARAERRGQSVGITALGPSIAMLPSATAASVAFAEVASFVDYWTAQNGRAALGLLLRELAVVPDADQALRAVSGLGVADWELRWREELGRRYAEPAASAEAPLPEEQGYRLDQRLRVAELLLDVGASERAARLLASDLDGAPDLAALRYAAAHAAEAAGWAEAPSLLGTLGDVRSAYGPWLALASRQEPAAGAGPEDPAATRLALSRHALGLDPLHPEVACAAAAAEPARLDLHKLCEHARALPRPELR